MEKEKAIKLVTQEYELDSHKCPPFYSHHEGLAVLWEDFEDLKAVVFSKVYKIASLEKQAKQVAVTAIRFLVELC